MPGQEGLGDSMKRHIDEAKLGKDKIAAALALAQSTYTIAEKDAKGNFGDKKYASLPSVWQACIPSLSKNEIATVSYTYWSIVSVAYDDGSPKAEGEENEAKAQSGFMMIFVVVELVHSSGQKFSSELPVVPERQLNKYNKRIRSEMQDISASKSLAKRQLFIDLAFANVAEEDHDSIPRNSDDDSGSNGRQQQDESESPAEDEFKKAKEAFINDCNASHAKFKAAGKESRFMQIVNDEGFESLKGINKVDDMTKIIMALKDAEEKLSEPDKPDSPPTTSS